MRSKSKRKKLFIAIAAGVFASLIMFNVLGGFNKKIQEQNNLINSFKEQANGVNNSSQNANLVQVVVAKKDIAIGSKFAGDSLEMKGMDPASMPEGTIKDVNSIVGLTASDNIVIGQAITTPKIKEFQKNNLDIPAGMRAITIPMESIQGFASYINIGSKVDIIPAAKNAEGVPNFVLQNVKIIAFESTVKPAAEGAPATNSMTGITFQIPAKYSSKLVEAMVNGKLQLTARNSNDNGLVSIVENKPNRAHVSAQLGGGGSVKMSIPPLPNSPGGLNFDSLNKSLAGLPVPATPPKKASRPAKKVEVIQANVKSDITFDN